MIASILSLISNAVRLALDWMARRREAMFVAIGRAQKHTEDLEARYDALREANKVRDAARAAAERDHRDGMSDDDGFRRD